MSRKIGEVGLFRPRRAFRLEVPQRLPKLELCVVRQRCCNALLYILRYSKYIQIHSHTEILHLLTRCIVFMYRRFRRDRDQIIRQP